MYHIKIMDLDTGKLVLDSKVVAAIIGASDGKGVHEMALIEANVMDAADAILATEHALEELKNADP